MKKKLMVLILCIVMIPIITGIVYIAITWYDDVNIVVYENPGVAPLNVKGYNAQFESCFGKNKRDNIARGLIKKVLNFNKTNELYDDISIIFNSGDDVISTYDLEELIKIEEDIINNKRKVYDIEGTAYGDDGFISEITITQKD